MRDRTWARAGIMAVGALVVVACSALTSFDDFAGDGGSGRGVPPDSSGAEAESGASSSGASGTPITDAAGLDAGALDAGALDAGALDAGPDAASCLQLAASCGKNGECCSGKCNQARSCVTTCLPSDAPCNPLADNECCVKTYCSPKGDQCKSCVSTGDPAELLDGGPNHRSCCSQKVNAAGDCAD